MGEPLEMRWIRDRTPGALCLTLPRWNSPKDTFVRAPGARNGMIAPGALCACPSGHFPRNSPLRLGKDTLGARRWLCCCGHRLNYSVTRSWLVLAGALDGSSLIFRSRCAFPTDRCCDWCENAPEHSEWHRWLAWYPVQLSDRPEKRVWLRFIKRRLGTSRVTGERKWRYRLSRQARH